jgi:hypothetical protein
MPELTGATQKMSQFHESTAFGFLLLLSPSASFASTCHSKTTMSGVNKVFSAGLGRNGRLAAWAVAAVGAVRVLNKSEPRRDENLTVQNCNFWLVLTSFPASLFYSQGTWIYMENRGNGDAYSKAEQKKWNAQKKAEADAKK